MNHYQDMMLTATAPIIWGTTYWVTSEYLPADYPITVAMLRALPAGLFLLLLVRHWPTKTQWLQATILGGLNFTIFWVCLFIAAYRLPGGVAATLGAIQPLIVMALSYIVLRQTVSIHAIFCAIAGIFGVALLVLQSSINLDGIGITAALCGALAMALGTILTKKWRGEIPLLTFTSWQLTAGGLLLLPLAWGLEPALPSLTMHHILGLSWLSIAGAAISYSLSVDVFKPTRCHIDWLVIARATLKFQPNSRMLHYFCQYYPK